MNTVRIGSQTLASGIGSILSNQRIKTKHMEQYLLRWINDTQLVEASAIQWASTTGRGSYWHSRLMTT